MAVPSKHVLFSRLRFQAKEIGFTHERNFDEDHLTITFEREEKKEKRDKKFANFLDKYGHRGSWNDECLVPGCVDLDAKGFRSLTVII